MKLFKILHVESGLFSDGADAPSLSKNGKFWKNKTGLCNHLTIVEEANRLEFYEDCEVVTFDITESDIPRTSVLNEYVPAKNERRNAKKYKRNN